MRSSYFADARVKRPASFILLLFMGLIVWAYWPSLNHIPRSDQVAYLADVNSRDSSWAQVIFSHYNNNRHRIFWPFEVNLFRPLFFILLGLERFCFGYRFWLWQATGIAFHLFTVWCLYRLLRTIRPGLAAALVAGGSGLLLVDLEAVIWQHTNGYVLFIGLVLMSVERLYRYSRDNGRKRGMLYQAVALMTAGIFLYEPGVMYCLMFAGYLFLMRSEAGRRGVVWFGLLVLFYGACSAIDYLSFPPIKVDEVAGASQPEGPLQIISAFLSTVKWFLFSGFFLSGDNIGVGHRLNIVNSTEVFSWKWPFITFPANMVSGLMVLVLFCGSFVVSWRRIISTPLTRTLAALLILMLTGQAAMIVTSRVILHRWSLNEVNFLRLNLNYLYQFWMVVPVVWYLSFDADTLGRSNARKAILAVCVGIWLGHVFLNAQAVRTCNERVAQRFSESLKLFKRVDECVGLHRRDPQFSFYVSPEATGNGLLEWIYTKKDPPERRYSFVEALYGPYFDSEQTKHVFP